MRPTSSLTATPPKLAVAGRSLQRLAFIAAVCSIGSLVQVERAQAGGLEYTGQGIQSLARGGAVAARADDPMVLAHNPAGLAELRGTQFLVDLNLAIFDACVDPIGFYGWGAYGGGMASRLQDPVTGEIRELQLGEGDRATLEVTEADYYVDPLDTVCLDQAVLPIPQIAWSKRLSESFGIGFGLVFPSAQPSGKWGGRSGVIRGDDGDLRPVPTRYMMLQSGNLAAFPNLGFGWRISDALRIGAAFEWGLIGANNYTMARASTGTSPHADIVAHIKAQDFFIPALTASIHLVPFDNLDLVVAGRWQDAFDGSGDVDLTTGLYSQTSLPETTFDVPIPRLTQSFPWKLRFGARYSSRLLPRPAGDGESEGDPAFKQVVHDPFQDEAWDIEVDVEYQGNSVNKEQVVTYGEDTNVFFVSAAGERSQVVFPTAGNDQEVIQKRWQDTVSIRAGGSYNPLPGAFGIMAGVHWENRGVDPAFMQIDFWPLQRLGLHAGGKFRILGNIDLTFAYAHIFQETITVAPPQHATGEDIQEEERNTGQITRIDKDVGPIVDRGNPQNFVAAEGPVSNPDAEARLVQTTAQSSAGQPPYIINSGVYRSSFDIFSVGVNLHF